MYEGLRAALATAPFSQLVENVEEPAEVQNYYSFAFHQGFQKKC
jgi:hypothetical protein